LIRGARIEAPKAPMGVRCGEGTPLSTGFCISNGDFWCILGAIFYSSDARFTHKKQRFGLEIGGQIHKLGVLSSLCTETANDTRNSLMETCFVSSLPSDVMRFAYSVTGPVGRTY